MKKTLFYCSVGTVLFSAALSANSYYCPTCQRGQNSGGQGQGYYSDQSYGNSGYNGVNNGYYSDRPYGNGGYNGDGYYGGNGNYSDRSYGNSGYNGGNGYSQDDRGEGNYSGSYNQGGPRGYRGGYDNQQGNWDRQDNGPDSMNRYDDRSNDRGGPMNDNERSRASTSSWMPERNWHLKDHEMMGILEDALQDNDYPNVNIAITRGMIILTGTIPSKEAKEDLKNKIRSLDLPASIDDRLEIAYSSDDETGAGDDSERDSNGRRVPDGEISRKIDDMVKPGTFSNGYPNVKFNVHQGHVTLNGSVDTESDRKSLLKKIIEIKGVRDIQSQIVVNKPSEKKVSDDEISKKIDDLVKPGTFSNGYPGVRFQVQDGRVTLTGSIDTFGHRKDLLKKIVETDGVVDVKNDVKVQKRDENTK